MQWLLMAIGVLLGAGIDSDSGWVLGGLIGLAIGQGLRLNSLERRLDLLHEALLKNSGAMKSRLAELGLPAVEPDAAADPWFAETPPPRPLAATFPPPPKTSLARETTEVGRKDAAMTYDTLEVAAPEPIPTWLRDAKPAEPGWLEKDLAAARAWLLGGNTVLRIGAILLFLGLAFLLRYAAERVVVPLELRYAGVALTAIGLLTLGWKLRLRNAAYGLMLQGTGVAVLYLTLFAAMRLHPLLPPAAAFVLMVLVTAAAAALAVLQDALALAVAAALGGFAAPILTSTGGGNHVGLFSYFLLLDAGILAIAWFRAWRALNLVGFLGTFGIGCAWGLKYYRPELLATTEPFLASFFLMYVAIGLLFARRTLRDAGPAPEGRAELLAWSARQGDAVDASTLFGPPLIGFGLQYAVIRHLEFGAAFSALGLGLFYALLASLLARRLGSRVLLLTETCLALAVVFGTLAIPLALDARWTAAAWAVEGAGIYWLGLSQQRPLARVFALLLQFAAGLDFLATLRPGTATLLDGAPLGALLLGVAGLFSHHQSRLAPPGQYRRWEHRLQPLLACGGLGFLYLTAPLLFALEATVICWALAGLATLWAGLRLPSRTFLYSAFAVQLLGGGLLLVSLRQDGAGAGVLDSGWHGLVTASLLGLALIGGMLAARRDCSVQGDAALLRMLAWVLLAGLVFINLAVLFVLPWHRVGAVWGGSGLLILWLGMTLRLGVALLFGLVLQLIGGISYLLAGPGLLADLPAGDLIPLAHNGFWTPAALAAAAFAGAWKLRRAAGGGEPQPLPLERAAALLLLWASAWWLWAWSQEAARFVTAPARVHVLLVVAAATVLGWAWVARRSRWPLLALLCLSSLIPAALGLLHDWLDGYRHPAADWGWLGWPALAFAYYHGLRRLPNLLPPRALSRGHILGCWLVLGLVSLELRHLVGELAEARAAWRSFGWALLPAAYLLAMASPRPLPGWPLAAHEREYRRLAAGPVAALLLFWFWFANAAGDGSAAPLPFLPLINPLETGLLLALFGIYQWSTCGGPYPDQGSRLPAAVTGLSLLALLTASVFRSAHHWAGIPYRLDSLLNSMLVQASLSLLWTTAALALMLVGHRRGLRGLWSAGAVLCGIVVVKLFLVDLGNHGGLERIFSFIGVGVLLLVIGYFAPLPPRPAAAAAPSSDRPRPQP